MRSILVVSALVLATGFNSPVLAKARRYAAPPPEPYYEEGPARGFYCVQLCPADMTPCDPAQFKRTDGRCTNPGGVSVN